MLSILFSNFNCISKHLKNAIHKLKFKVKFDAMLIVFVSELTSIPI